MLNIPFFLILVISFTLESFVAEKELEGKYLKTFWILLALGIFLIPFHAFLALMYPFLLGQVMIDFYKMELSDVNNVCLFLLSCVHGFLYGWNFNSFVIISIFFLLLYFLPFSDLGFGDVKLSIALSLMIPFKTIPSFIFYSMVLGLVLGIFYKKFKKQNVFPMGPCIIVMFVIIQILGLQHNFI